MMSGMQRFLFTAVMLLSSATLVPASAAAEPPVILVTGFEPFGGAKQNPSWEGAQRLDGVEWQGYRIVARQLPVVWGAPQEHLSKWIDELKPVAIFSFGQGGGYALETRARNQRGKKARDNLKHLPPQREIIEGGPDAYEATIDAKRLVDALAEKEYRVAISRDAGQYLCEECLYTLEHLRATKDLKANVLFCHIPPLKEDRYTAEDAERFMRAMLESWREVYRP
jgi:pyroglutamyl-peptidase